MAGPNKVYRFRKFLFWAQGGRIYIQDETIVDDESKPLAERCKTIDPQELYDRISALWEQHKDNWNSVRREMEQLGDDGIACIKEARRQGDITDPRVVRDMLNHGRKRSSILLPSNMPAFPAMPMLATRQQRGPKTPNIIIS